MIIMKYEKLLKIPNFLRFFHLYTHYVDIFLISKGYFSKYLPLGIKRDIAHKFCRIMHFPSEISNIISSYEFNILQVDNLGDRALKLLSQITNNDIIQVFSQLSNPFIHR